METNGCGGKGSWIKPPYRKFFEASCNKHDLGYNKGGNDADRFECDAKFLVMMLKDTYRIGNCFKRVYYQLWAFIYYLSVRIFGKKFWNEKS